MCRLTLATLALLLATFAVPPRALAQTIYFEDTFDSDLDRWTTGAVVEHDAEFCLQCRHLLADSRRGQIDRLCCRGKATMLCNG